MYIDGSIAALDGDDPDASRDAARELLARGPAAVQSLVAAGACPAPTLDPSRLDMVYTLVSCQTPLNARRDRFGVTFRDGVAEREVRRVLEMHGLAPASDGPPDWNLRPQMFVKPPAGVGVEGAMRELMSTEATVKTVSFELCD